MCQRQNRPISERGFWSCFARSLEFLQGASGKLALEVLERVNRELGAPALVITYSISIFGMARWRVRRRSLGGWLVAMSGLRRFRCRDGFVPFFATGAARVAFRERVHREPLVIEPDRFDR
jgi:hypothetical protein